MKHTKTTDQMNEIADEVLSIIQSGNMPEWVKPWNGLFTPTNAHTGNAFSGLNVWASILAMQRGEYSSPLFVASGQAKKLMEQYNNENDGEDLFAFKKGGKADTYHFRPIMYKIKKTEKDDDEAPDRFAQGFRSYPVWNIENTNIPAKWALERLGIEEREPVDASDLWSVVQSNLDGVRIVDGGAAYYTPSTDTITMPPMTAWESIDDYACVLLHEASHATGHPLRLARPLGGYSARDGDYAVEELIAELSSVAACGVLGYKSNMNRSAAYLAGWASRTPQKEARKAILKALTRSSAAAAWVVGGRPESHDGATTTDGATMDALEGITTEH